MSIEPIAMGELQPEATLEDCEKALHEIERGAAVAQGQVLKHIRDNDLYKAKHATFEDYVEKDLGYERTWAYRRIDLAQTVQMLPIGNTPVVTNEGQARAIKPILRDHGPEVAAEVLRDAADGSGKITARSIDEAKSRHPATRPTLTPEPEPVEELTAADWMEREEEDLSDPDVSNLVPESTRFEMAFWTHIGGVRELCADLDYPHYFSEPMGEQLADAIDTLARKHREFTNLRRGLRVVEGGKS